MSVKKMGKVKRKKPVRRHPKSTEQIPPKHKRVPPSPFKNGNTLWERRKRHGREKTFANPQALLDVFEEYVNWAREYPIISVEKASFEGMPTTQEIPLRRLVTVQAFCVYAGTDEDFLTEFKGRLNRGEVSKDTDREGFLGVIKAIKEYCEVDMKEGATAQQFNANLISRMLGLADRSDITSAGEKIQTTMPELTIKIENNTPGFANAEAEVKDKKK